MCMSDNLLIWLVNFGTRQNLNTNLHVSKTSLVECHLD